MLLLLLLLLLEVECESAAEQRAASILDEQGDGISDVLKRDEMRCDAARDDRFLQMLDGYCGHVMRIWFCRRFGAGFLLNEKRTRWMLYAVFGRTVDGETWI